MYDRILLGTDGGVASERALDHAVDLAAAHDATLHVVHVVDSDVYTAYSGDEFVDEHEGPEHALAERGREALGEATNRAVEAEVKVVESLEYGVPDEQLLDYAAEAEVDLVVVGTRRRPEEYRALLGSVAERVVRLAERPVLVVKTPE